MPNTYNELLVDILEKYDGTNKKGLSNSLEEILNKYNISSKDKEPSSSSDSEEKIHYFLACKKMEGLSDSTLKNYGYILKNFFLVINKPTNLINILDLRTYINKKATTVKASSLEPIIWALKSFFGWLLSEGYLETNPTAKLKVAKRESRIREGLTIESIEKLRNACNTPRERALLELFLSTGCRVSELVELKISNVKNGSIKVVGKGSKERFVYINEKAMMYLNLYLKSRPIESDYLFISHRKPYDFISTRTMEKEISNIGKRVDIKVFCHLLRHTFATTLINNGAPIHVVQLLLGHESPNTTEIYAKMSEDNIRNQYNKYGMI